MKGLELLSRLRVPHAPEDDDEVVRKGDVREMIAEALPIVWVDEPGDPTRIVWRP
jgi:hypothetical protein